MDLCMVNIPNGASGKESPTGAEDIRDAGSIPGSGRSPGEGNGDPLQYSCLGNPMDRGPWQVAVHRVSKNWIRLSDSTTTSRRTTWVASRCRTFRDSILFLNPIYFYLAWYPGPTQLALQWRILKYLEQLNGFVSGQ